MRADTVIVGGKIVSGHGIVESTIAIDQDRISALVEPGIAIEARNVVDASGLLVLPGLVDAHVHLREPGFAWKEGFANGTRVAALGGVTTILIMPTDKPLTLTAKDYEAKVKLAEGKCHVDVGILALLGPDTSELGDIASLGVMSVEVFLAGLSPPYRVEDNAALFKVIERAAALGLTVGITSGDDSLTQAIAEQLRSAGRQDPLAYALSRPPAAEALSVARGCVVAAETGARIHLRQVSCRSALRVIRAYRQYAAGLTAECLPHHLFLTAADLVAQGPFAKMGPPLRSQADIDSLWEGLRDRSIDMVATDHAPHLPEEKDAGKENIWKAPLGVPGLQTWLPLMLEGVADGLISVCDLVRICCEAPSRVFGLYPRKGALLPGSDADLVIVDPTRTFEIRNEDQASLAGRTPFHGRRVRGVPLRTMLRGRTVMRDGQCLGPPAGRVLTRR